MVSTVKYAKISGFISHLHFLPQLLLLFLTRKLSNVTKVYYLNNKPLKAADREEIKANKSKQGVKAKSVF